MNIKDSLIDSISAIGAESDMATGKDSPFVTETSPGFAYKFTNDVFVMQDTDTNKISMWCTDDSDKPKAEKTRILLRLACAAYFHNTYMTSYKAVESEELEEMEKSLVQRAVIDVPAPFVEAGKFFFLFNAAAMSISEECFHRSTPIEVGALVSQMLKTDDVTMADRWNQGVEFGAKTYLDTFQDMYDICVTMGLKDYKASANVRPSSFNINWQPTAQWLEKKMEEVRASRFDDEHEGDSCPCPVCRMRRASEKLESVVAKLEEKL